MMDAIFVPPVRKIQYRNTVFESYNLCHISVVDNKEIAAEHKIVHMTELQLYMENKCIKILSGFIRMN